MLLFLFASFLKQEASVFSEIETLVSGFVRTIQITNEQAVEQRKQGWNPNKGPSHPERAQYISAMVQKPIETTLWLKTYGAMGSSSWTTLPWLFSVRSIKINQLVLHEAVTRNSAMCTHIVTTVPTSPFL
jgi:hypothetical protein